MKINVSDVLNIQKPQSDKVYEPVKTGRDSGLQRSSTTAPADGIDLGSQSGLLALAQQAGSSERESRVQELRALVQSGQYQVDTRALSSSIVNAAIAGL